MFGLALGATAAIAAPVLPSKPEAKKPSSGAPTPTGSGCSSTPDKAKCLSIVTVSGNDIPFLETSCGITHRETCRQYVDDALAVYGPASHADSSVPTVEMLRPGKSDMPVDLKDGKYHRHTASASGLVSDYEELRKPYKQTNDLLKGIGGRNMADELPLARNETRSAVDAIKYWRNTGWRDNGPQVRSCKEYAYARSFNATRFIDAASDCRGDRECVFDVAYAGAPEGITNGPLLDEDDKLMTQQLVLPGGTFQKNDFFPKRGEEFVRSNGLEDPLADTNAIVALKQTLIQGQTWYKAAPCSGASCNKTRNFDNIWKWHSGLHTLTADMSEAEAEQYERRRAKFRRLLDEWNAAVEGEIMPPKSTMQKYVSPLDMRAIDPFKRFDLAREYIERGRDQRVLLQKQFGNQLLQMNSIDALKVIRGAVQQQGSYRSGTPAVGVLGMPAPAPAPKTAGNTTPKSKKKNGPKPVNANFCVRNHDEWGLELMMQGPVSCQIGAFLRAEWDRHAAGQRSCLDLDNPRCDWSMALFEANVLGQLPALDAQLSDEQYCMAYLDTDTFKDFDDARGIAHVTNVRKRLDATREFIEKELKEVGEYRQGRSSIGERLGKDWTGGDYAGDKKSFGAGYDYDIGWQLEPAEKAGDGPAGRVCALKGSIHGNMSFDAFLVGDKYPVVSGAVRVRSQPGSGGNAEYNAYLNMFEMSLYQSEKAGWAGTQTFADSSTPGKSVSVPDVRPRFDVMVGPVPVSGEVWGELMFASSLSVGGNASTECTVTAPRFALDGGYMPSFTASGNGKVGVGIAGLVSAGIRATLTLVRIGTPLEFGIAMSSKDGKPSVQFTSDVSLYLATLGGRVSLYIEFLLYEEEFELFRWKGLSHTIPLMKKTANVSLLGLK